MSLPITATLTLNADCLLLVFKELKRDPRALFNCLLVSKEWFHLASTTLYRQPQHYFTETDLQAGLSKRLDNLLHVCSGYYDSVQLTDDKADELKERVPLQPAINYYDLVQQYPSPNDQRSFSIQYYKSYARTMTDMCISLENISETVPFLSMFRVLDSLHLLQVHLLPSYLPDLLEFIKIHRTSYPGQLQFVDGYRILTNWNAHVKVMRALTPVSRMNIYLRPSSSLEQLPAEGLQRLRVMILKGNGQDDEKASMLQAFLMRCRDLKSLRMIGAIKDVFQWVLADKTHWHNSNIVINNNNINNKSTAVPALETTSSLLVQRALPTATSTMTTTKTATTEPIRLQHLQIEGSAIASYYALMAFSDTLKSFSLNWCPSKDDLSSLNTLLSNLGNCQMPVLETLWVESFPFDPSYLALYPALRTLKLTTSKTTVTKTLWKLPITIVHLTLLNQVMSFTADLDSLKYLVFLETLYLTGKSTDTHPELEDPCYYQRIDMVPTTNNAGDKDGETVEGWHFPHLKSVKLHGWFAKRLQASILWAVPRLEFLTLDTRVLTEGQLDLYSILFPSVSVVDQNRNNGQKIDPAALDPWSSSASFQSLKSLSLRWTTVTETAIDSESMVQMLFGSWSNPDLLASDKGDGDNDDLNELPKQAAPPFSLYIFPSLERLEFASHFKYFWPVVLTAMKRPGMQYVRYLSPIEQRHEQDASWSEQLEEVAENETSSQPSYCVLKLPATKQYRLRKHVEEMGQEGCD